MPSMVRRVVLVLAAILAAAVSAATAGGTPPGAATGPAPGAPGTDEGFLPADKSGVGTSTTLESTTWLTVQKEGGLGELFYPDLGTPSARALQFIVADRHRRKAWLVNDAADVTTRLLDDHSLLYQQTFRARDGRWALRATYVTDPARSTVLVKVRLATGKTSGYRWHRHQSNRRYGLYAIYDPALSNTRDDDAGATQGSTLVATDDHAASAFMAWPAFRRVSNGVRGTSDGWTDLLGDGRMDWQYASAPASNLVQTAELRLDHGHAQGTATLAIGFGANAGAAIGTARASLKVGFGASAQAYAEGWHGYVDGLKDPPPTLTTADQQRLYTVSAMVLAASEDKLHRGAYIASHSMPWVWRKEKPSGPYHLVWSRDLYQIATGLIAAGDTAGANRALDFLFDVQQKPDGSFPQNSDVTGKPVWGGLQLDEVALPMVLAWQLGRTDAATWSHVKRAADFLLAFEQEGHTAPWSPQDRWENQSGYSPATIAAEIAGLVCAAEIAKANGDTASATKYLETADAWQQQVKAWTVTTTGPYSSGPYFLRLTKDGNPNAGTTYNIGDSGPTNVDQRRVVDPSFLDLVRLGVLPADDPAIVNSLGVIDAQLGYQTPRGFFWHRASFDGYGEKRDGSDWEFGLPDDSRITLGRGWPLLNGERGEYQLAAGQLDAGTAQVATITNAMGPGYMLPEQVWDDQPPSGTNGFVPGTPTFSATPLAWTHAQYLRLAWNAAAGKVLEQPSVVAQRYGGTPGPGR